MYQSSYELNFVPGGVPRTIHISQYDVGLRQFHFTPIAVPGQMSAVSGAVATLEATKPDGNAVVQSCTYNNDGTIDYVVQEQLAAVAGKVWSKIVLRSGADVIGAAAIVWMVDRAGVADDANLSDSDISGLEGYVDQMKTLVGTPIAVTTAAGMTDHTKLYLYEGSETGYTAGNWYYWNGSAWTSGGAYGSDAVEVDPTLSIAGDAADAKATGDGLAELKTDINTVAHDSVSESMLKALLEQKGYTGAYSFANSENRASVARPVRFPKPIILKFDSSTYYVEVIKWNDHTMSSTTFISKSGWVTSPIIIEANTYFTITVRYISNANITPVQAEDAINIYGYRAFTTPLLYNDDLTKYLCGKFVRRGQNNYQFIRSTNRMSIATPVKFDRDIAFTISKDYNAVLFTYSSATPSSSTLIRDYGWLYNYGVPFIIPANTYFCISLAMANLSSDINQNVLMNDAIQFYDNEFKFPSANVYSQKNLASKLVNKGYNSAYGYAYSATRCSMVVPRRTESEITIVFESGFSGIALTWSDYNLSSDTMIDAWEYTDKIVIPAKTLFTITVRNNQNTAITPDEAGDCFAIYGDFETHINRGYKYGASHRGCMAVAPENTIPAFKLAKAYGWNMFECDVQKTADSNYVILHDATINRTSNGTGNVADLTLAQLLTYDFGSWYNASYAGTKIPTLEEMLLCARNLGMTVLLEVKDTAAFTNDDIANIVGTVKKCGMRDNVYYVSFSLTYLTAIKNYDGTAKLIRVVPSELNASFIDATAALKTNTNVVGLALSASYYSADAVTLAKNAGMLLNCTANTLSVLNGYDDYLAIITSDYLVSDIESCVY